MKIQFLKPYTDPADPNRVYQPGWVAEFTDADAQRAIDAGFAKPASPDAFCRKYAAPELVSTDCVPQSMSLHELTEQRPQAAPKTARFRL